MTYQRYEKGFCWVPKSFSVMVEGSLLQAVTHKQLHIISDSFVLFWFPCSLFCVVVLRWFLVWHFGCVSVVSLACSVSWSPTSCFILTVVFPVLCVSFDPPVSPAVSPWCPSLGSFPRVLFLFSVIWYFVFSYNLTSPAIKQFEFPVECRVLHSNRDTGWFHRCSKQSSLYADHLFPV